MNPNFAGNTTDRGHTLTCLIAGAVWACAAGAFVYWVCELALYCTTCTPDEAGYLAWTAIYCWSPCAYTACMGAAHEEAICMFCICCTMGTVVGTYCVECGGGPCGGGVNWVIGTGCTTGWPVPVPFICCCALPRGALSEGFGLVFLDCAPGCWFMCCGWPLLPPGRSWSLRCGLVFCQVLSARTSPELCCIRPRWASWFLSRSFDLESCRRLSYRRSDGFSSPSHSILFCTAPLDELSCTFLLESLWSLE